MEIKKKFVLKEDNSVTEETTSPTQPTVAGNFTHTALGMCRDEKNQWVVAKVKYDPKTLQGGSVEFITDDGSRPSAQSKFKVEVVHNVFAPAMRE